MAGKTTLEGIDAKLDGVVLSRGKLEIEIKTHRDDYKRIEIEQALVRQRMDYYDLREKDNHENRQKLWDKIRALEDTKIKWVAYVVGLIAMTLLVLYIYEHFLKGKIS